jgi:hypothetical protein
MHIAIRRYQVDPGSVEEVMRSAEEGFIPLIKDASGFLAYYALDAGEGVIATGNDPARRTRSDWSASLRNSVTR